MNQFSNGQIIVISLGGSLICPNSDASVGAGGNVDVKFLRKFRQFILSWVKRGKKFAIVTGGGRLARNYQEAAGKIFKNVSATDKDTLGITATRYHAFLVKAIFGDLAEVIQSADITNPKIDPQRSIAIFFGTKPGRSSDFSAALVAKNFGAVQLGLASGSAHPVGAELKGFINMSNTAGVYDKDPRKFKNAKMFQELKWSEYEKIISKHWKPGMSAPIDPTTAEFMRKNKLKVFAVKGGDLKNLGNLIAGRGFKGTTLG